MSSRPHQSELREPLSTRDFGVLVSASEASWAARLRAALSGEAIAVEELESLSDVKTAMRRRPASVAVVELAAGGLEPVADVLWHAQRRFAAVRMIVLAQRGMEPCEALARELGAIHFAVMPRDLGPLVETIRRRHGELPRPRCELIDPLPSRLPWPEWATGGRRSTKPPTTEP